MSAPDPVAALGAWLVTQDRNADQIFGGASRIAVATPDVPGTCFAASSTILVPTLAREVNTSLPMSERIPAMPWTAPVMIPVRGPSAGPVGLPAPRTAPRPGAVP